MQKKLWVFLLGLFLISVISGCWADETKPAKPRIEESPTSSAWSAKKMPELNEVEQFAQRNSVKIFYLDLNYHAVVNLEPLQPIPKGLRAILAMYALQAGGGCAGYNKTGLKCKLTTELGLGAQCSEKHTEFVRSWFGKEIPPMSGHSERVVEKAIKSGNFQSICYNSPDTATRQRIWESIRINKQNNSVLIEATNQVISDSDGLGKRIYYRTKYLIGPNEVTLITHKESF